MLEVELSRYQMSPDDPSDVAWAAEWGLRGDEVGTEDNAEDVRELVDAVLNDARHWAAEYDLRIEWSVTGDRPRGQTIEAEIAAAGVVLPTTLPD